MLALYKEVILDVYNNQVKDKQSSKKELIQQINEQNSRLAKARELPALAHASPRVPNTTKLTSTNPLPFLVMNLYFPIHNLKDKQTYFKELLIAHARTRAPPGAQLKSFLHHSFLRYLIALSIV